MPFLVQNAKLSSRPPLQGPRPANATLPFVSSLHDQHDKQAVLPIADCCGCQQLYSSDSVRAVHIRDMQQADQAFGCTAGDTWYGFVLH